MPRPVDTAQTTTTYINAIRSHYVTDTVRVLGIHRPEKAIVTRSTRTTKVVTTETATNPLTITTTTTIRCHAGFRTQTDSVE
ncbi:hypothetical protein DPMN_156941 [Dreissena polymorpha]|uniref:Uncharacterized protein n=1 Tax=Dreissena polymorpha TaxID=45954 RepID=A0A9D4JB92_DREPO|nr:hypothetical protein DPMN_156941 [Dreissena polymorpha]